MALLTFFAGVVKQILILLQKRIVRLHLPCVLLDGSTKTEITLYRDVSQISSYSNKAEFEPQYGSVVQNILITSIDIKLKVK